MRKMGVRDRMSWRIAMGLASVALSVAQARARYGGGSGTVEDPYQIWTAAQLNTIGVDPDDLFKNFKLMADIDLAAYQEDNFHLIGFQWVGRDDNGDFKRVNAFFRGVFDGNGHTISNLTYTIKGPDPRDGDQGWGVRP